MAKTRPLPFFTRFPADVVLLDVVGGAPVDVGWAVVLVVSDVFGLSTDGIVPVVVGEATLEEIGTDSSDVDPVNAWIVLVDGLSAVELGLEVVGAMALVVEGAVLEVVVVVGAAVVKAAVLASKGVDTIIGEELLEAAKEDVFWPNVPPKESREIIQSYITAYEVPRSRTS